MAKTVEEIMGDTPKTIAEFKQKIRGLIVYADKQNNRELTMLAVGMLESIEITEILAKKELW